MSHATPHRLLYFFVAFVLLMFFGLIYAWSLFVDPLEAEFGWDRSATSVVFTLSIITFCAGMLVAGALEERTSPRTVMLITAACLGLGLIASAFAAGMLCCAFAMMGGNFLLLVAGFMLLGLMYGGNMCSMSAMVGTFFGPKYYGINYAIATCQMIPAAIVGPQILALSQMGSGSYLGAFWVFFAVAIAALAVSFFIKPPKNNRAA